MKKIYFLIALLTYQIGTFAQTVPSYVPTSGLLAWYSFSGNTNDNSGNGYDGTAVGGAALTSDRFGHANSAYLFNGSNSSISTNLLPPIGNRARTMSCWFQYDSLPNPCGDAGLCLLGYGADNRACSEACKNFSMEMVYAPNRASIDGVCIATRESSPLDTLDNTWHFFAAIYDSSYGDFTNIKIYIDGAYRTTATDVYGGSTAVMTDTLSRMEIGAGHYLDCRRFFAGKIDDIGVWNRALNETELFFLYNTVPTAASASFSVYDNDNCSGIQYEIVTTPFTTGQHVKTYFGNGETLDTVITAAGTNGVANISEQYANSGNYTIKHILYSGTTAIDSITYNREYALCNTLFVQYYNDLNADCNYEAGSDAIISMPMLTEVDSNGTPVDTISSAGGFYYTAFGNAGDIYSFKTISHPETLVNSCPVSGIITDTLQSSNFLISKKYLGMVCSTTPTYDLSLHAVVNATGSNDQSGNIYIENTTSCALIDATITLNFSSKFIPLDIADGSIYNMVPPPTAITSNSVSWNLSGLTTPGTVPVSLWYAIYHNPSIGYLAIGDTVHTNYTVTPTSGDSDTTNNTATLVEIVKAGCDPNEMWVSPNGCIPPTTGTTKLQYTIMFENTGNDTAHNIYLLDTLSNNLDLSTMRMVMTSAPMNISKSMTPTGQNIIRFDFPKINLLDSSHHGQCTSTVIFTIDTKPALTEGVLINNSAGVYFDYNSVVMTNLVQNIVGCSSTYAPTVVSNKEIDLYPNPTKNELIISSPDLISNIVISSILGQQVYEQQYNSNKVQIDVSNLCTGIYFIKVNGSEVRKFVKY